MREALESLAAINDGLFTTDQASLIGVNEYELDRLTKRKVIRRVLRGVYVVASHDPRHADTVDAHRASPAREHLLRGRAAVLWYRDAVLSHDAALLAHGLPVWNISDQRTHIARPIGRLRRTSALTIHPTGFAAVPTNHGPAVPAPVAMLQVASSRGVLCAIAAADEGLRTGATSARELRVLIDTWPSPLWHSELEQLVSLMDARAESPGESLVRAYLRLAGFDVVPQEPVADESGQIIARLDLRIASIPVAIEFDGRQKYAAAHDLWAEKRREDRLRALGWNVVRFTWTDLHYPQRIVARVRDAAAQHTGPDGKPRASTTSEVA